MHSDREQESGFYTGRIEAVDIESHKYWVTFDRPGLGKHPVADTEIRVGLRKKESERGGEGEKGRRRERESNACSMYHSAILYYLPIHMIFIILLHFHVHVEC